MKTICKLMIVGALALAATPAAATTFSGTYGVDLNTVDPGLKLEWAPITPLSVQLNALNDHTTISLFNLFTSENNLEWPEDYGHRDIAVNFHFTTPGISNGSITGGTEGESFGLFGFYQDGKVTWNNGGNALFNFTNGSQLSVHLDNAIFNAGDWWGLNEGPEFGAPIQATFTLSQVGNSVPEPATWAMMILGMGMVGAGLRMRRRQANVLA